MKPTDPCPGEDQLRDVPAHGPVAMHVAGCSRCRALVADLAAEVEYGRLLRAARRETGPLVRERLITTTVRMLEDADRL